MYSTSTARTQSVRTRRLQCYCLYAEVYIVFWYTERGSRLKASQYYNKYLIYYMTVSTRRLQCYCLYAEVYIVFWYTEGVARLKASQYYNKYLIYAYDPV
jgi:restriction endonuclease S subunit